ncbi:TetR family transcriptional regulator [Acrocarpospora catenulata]|uniref:TetR family transcriptional regulator n=1 Tax=Acrocarpospora catenulata TaxID=2836182 RepID=UPI001BDA519D|nr:TetR family transcriptional regulator [Acrocarpospora catenulata]
MTVARRSANRIPAEERRQQILECATELFALQGFDSTTMDDIARAAKITKRTLYRYVTSKEELLFELHDSFTVQQLFPQATDNGDPVDLLVAFISRHVQMVAEHPTAIGVFFGERKHLSEKNAKLIERRRDDYESAAVSIIRMGIDQGEFVDVNARVVAQAMLGAMTEMHRWYQPDGPLTVPGIAELTTDLFLRGAAADRSQALPTASPAPQVTTSAVNAGRQKVVDAATKSFARAGYHASSIRDLADVAEITKGAVMYHAGYKHDLLEEIHRNTYKDSIAQLQSALRGVPTDPVAMLVALIRSHTEFVAARRDAIAVINENMRYLEPIAHRSIDKLNVRWVAIFRDVIEAGVDSGRLRPLDAGLMTRTLIGMFNSAARWYNPTGRLSPAELADIFARLFVLGLLSNGE